MIGTSGIDSTSAACITGDGRSEDLLLLVTVEGPSDLLGLTLKL